MQANHLESVTFSTQFISITIIVPGYILLPGKRMGRLNKCFSNEWIPGPFPRGWYFSASKPRVSQCFSKLLSPEELPVEIWDAPSGEVIECVGNSGFFCLLSAPKREELTQEWWSGSEVHLLLTVPGNAPQRGCFISSADFVFPGWSWANRCASPSLSLFTYNMGISVPTLQGFCKNSVRQYANSLAQVCGYG